MDSKIVSKQFKILKLYVWILDLRRFLVDINCLVFLNGTVLCICVNVLLSKINFTWHYAYLEMLIFSFLWHEIYCFIWISCIFCACMISIPNRDTLDYFSHLNHQWYISYYLFVFILLLLLFILHVTYSFVA